MMALSLRIPIIATPRADGEGKTKNSPPGQVHREDIMNHEDAFFHTNIVMTACAHGVWDEKNNDMTPATFLLFTCEIQSMREFRVKKIRLEIDFRNVDDQGGKRPLANPTIVSRAPHVIERYEKISVLRRRERGITGSLEVSEIVKPGIALHQINTQEYEQQYFAEARSGVRHASSTDHRYVKVWWIYKENKKGAAGVVPGFRVAVLLKRDNGSPFEGRLAITEFEAGWRYHGAVMWHDFWSERSPETEDDKIIDPINFNPTTPGQIIPGWLTGIDTKQLANLQTETGIDKKYARIWGVDM